MFAVSEEWKAAYPGAAAGLLARSGVQNPASHPVLDARKAELEKELRARFANGDRAALVELCTRTVRCGENLGLAQQ